MAMVRLNVSIKTGSMFEKIDEIQNKLREVRRLVDELESMSGNYRTIDQSGLPELEEIDEE